MLFDWFCDHGVVDLDAVRATVEAYVAAGGPGPHHRARPTSRCCSPSRLNFLLGQLSVALAPGVDQRHRDWAEREIDEALRMLPDAGPAGGGAHGRPRVLSMISEHHGLAVT